MIDPIREMEREARKHLPSLHEQGIYLWQEPFVVILCVAIVALAGWMMLFR